MKKFFDYVWRGVAVWFLTFFDGYIMGCIIFPIDEATNTLFAPDWYIIATFLLSCFTAICTVKLRKKVVSSRAIDSIDKKIDYFDRPVIDIAKSHIDNSVDEKKIIQDEENWRRQQSGMSISDYEIRKADAMDGYTFEQWCAELLRNNAFENVSVTRGSGDQGVDVIARKDGIYYAIQCKCYSSDIGNKPIQEVFAGKEMYDCQVAVVMTNRHFTAGAKELAKKTRVLLWDREKLINLLESRE